MEQCEKSQVQRLQPTLRTDNHRFFLPITWAPTSFFRPKPQRRSIPIWQPIQALLNCNPCLFSDLTAEQILTVRRLPQRWGCRLTDSTSLPAQLRPPYLEAAGSQVHQEPCALLDPGETSSSDFLPEPASSWRPSSYRSVKSETGSDWCLLDCLSWDPCEST